MMLRRAHLHPILAVLATALIVTGCAPRQGQTQASNAYGYWSFGAPISGNGTVREASVDCFRGFWFIAVSGPDPVDTELPATVTIDGTAYRTIVNQTGEEPRIALDDRLLTRLKRGNRVSFAYRSLQGGVSAGYSLKGSSRGIDAAARVCAGSSPASAADGIVSPDEFRRDFVGRSLEHRFDGGFLGLFYKPDGTYDGDNNGRFGENGTYRLQRDGRVCWRTGAFSGCFLYYRENGTLLVRRADDKSTAVIGRVVFE